MARFFMHILLKNSATQHYTPPLRIRVSSLDSSFKHLPHSRHPSTEPPQATLLVKFALYMRPEGNLGIGCLLTNRPILD